MQYFKFCLAVLLAFSFCGCDRTTPAGKTLEKAQFDKQNNAGKNPQSKVIKKIVSQAAPQQPIQSESAGMSFTHWLDGLPIDGMIVNSNYDVVIATVVKVTNKNCINANPPMITLDVTEVLYGKTKPGLYQNCLWAAYPHDVDTAPIKSNPRYIAWAKQPLASPKIGKRMILLGNFNTTKKLKGGWISPVGRFEFSKKTKVSGQSD